MVDISILLLTKKQTSPNTRVVNSCWVAGVALMAGFSGSKVCAVFPKKADCTQSCKHRQNNPWVPSPHYPSSSF